MSPWLWFKIRISFFWLFTCISVTIQNKSLKSFYFLNDPRFYLAHRLSELSNKQIQTIMTCMRPRRTQWRWNRDYCSVSKELLWNFQYLLLLGYVSAIFVIVSRGEEEWNYYFPVPVLKEHVTVTRSPKFAILYCGAEHSSQVISLRPQVSVCEVPARDNNTIAQGSISSLVVFLLSFTSKLPNKLNFSIRNHRIYFWFHYGFLNCLRHVHARVGRKNLFSFWSERSFCICFQFKTSSNRNLGGGWPSLDEKIWREKRMLFLLRVGENQVSSKFVQFILYKVAFVWQTKLAKPSPLNEG